MLNKKLIQDHNFKNIALENLYTASYLTSLYIKDELIPKLEKSHGITEPSVYVIGENGFKHELHQNGIKVKNFEEAEYRHPSNAINMDAFSQI